MGRYNKQGNKKTRSGPVGGNRGGGYIGNPKIPKGKKGKSSPSDNAKKSPLLQHFFFWVVVLSMFMGIFGGFPDAIQSVVLWNDFYTLFGVIPYWTATVGWLITIMVAMCIDMIRVS